MAEPPQRTDPKAQTEVAPMSFPLSQRSAPPSLGIAEGAPLVAGRYEIVAMLGSGGMGTVYSARDRELDETVALKVLKKELAATPGMLDRFRREVKLARRVTHKNVARTFDIGESDGDRFLTMELVEGEMLGSLLARRGRVPVAEVASIGRDVCAGLAAAHAAGVLHRDLKPENVIVARDGRAVITDFGIARALAQAELARTSGGMVGTPAYMAPEQVEGKEDLDARADLYALGAMLYELLSGSPAWDGATIIAAAAARLMHPPPDVRALVPSVPAAAAELVLKLMARDRDARFATAEEAGAALAALATSAASLSTFVMPDAPALPAYAVTPSRTARAKRKTVAVLPIANLGSADDQYLAQTLTEDLVDLLSVVPELRVRPRGDTARFDRAPRDVRDIGRELDVDVVVDGSVRRIDTQVRVSVRLVTVEDGFQLWAHRFDRPAERVLTVADDAAAAIARALTTELVAEARPTVTDPIAQELYLRGRYDMQRGWFEIFREGVAKLKEAHQRAPQDTRIAGAYALALARFMGADGGTSPQAAEETREMAERTLSVDPSQPDARVALALVNLNHSEAAAAAAQLGSALVIAPNNVDALDAIGRMLLEVGEIDRGIAILHRALAIEPGMTQARVSVARAQSLNGDDEAARVTLGSFPVDTAALTSHLLIRARFTLWHRDAETAADLAKVLAASTITAYGKQAIMALLYVAEHGQAPSGADLDLALPFDSRFQPRRVAFHAQIRTELRLRLGDVDGAVADLAVADTNGLFDLHWLERCPLLKRLRDGPDFKAVHEHTSTRASRISGALTPSLRRS